MTKNKLGKNLNELSKLKLKLKQGETDISLDLELFTDGGEYVAEELEKLIDIEIRDQESRLKDVLLNEFIKGDDE